MQFAPCSILTYTYRRIGPRLIITAKVGKVQVPNRCWETQCNFPGGKPLQSQVVPWLKSTGGSTGVLTTIETYWNGLDSRQSDVVETSGKPKCMNSLTAGTEARSLPKQSDSKSSKETLAMENTRVVGLWRFLASILFKVFPICEIVSTISTMIADGLAQWLYALTSCWQNETLQGSFMCEYGWYAKWHGP